ncbi:MAG: hypothetical protein ACIAXF_14415, partial [Phycisphaerales bacterium JB063]
AATVISFWSLGRYDAIAHRHLGTDIRARSASRAGVCAIAFSQTVGFGLLTGCRSNSEIGAWHEATDPANEIAYEFKEEGLVFRFEGWADGAPRWARAYQYEINDDKLTLIPHGDSDAEESEGPEVFHFQQVDPDTILLRYVTDENTTTHIFFRSPGR